MQDKSVCISEEVLFEVVDDEYVILDLKSGHYFGLNPTGTIVWKAIDEGLTLNEIVARVREKVSRAPDTVATDVSELIECLAKNNLVKSGGSH